MKIKASNDCSLLLFLRPKKVTKKGPLQGVATTFFASEAAKYQQVGTRSLLKAPGDATNVSGSLTYHQT